MSEEKETIRVEIVKKPWYKRWWAILLCVIVGLSVISSVANQGSGPQKVGESAPAAQPAQQTTAPEQKTEFERNDKVQVGNLVFSVVDAKQAQSSNEYIKPQDGKVFYQVSLALENTGNEKQDYNAFSFKIEDATGNQKDATFGPDVSQPLNSGSLAPGGKTTGDILFEVPADMKGLKLIHEPNIFLKEQIKIKLTD